MLQRLLLAAIERYRASGGGKRWFGVDCNFEPSCSAYAHEAIGRFGPCRGTVLAWRRIRRCTARDSICKCHEPCPEALPDA